MRTDYFFEPNYFAIFRSLNFRYALFVTLACHLFLLVWVFNPSYFNLSNSSSSQSFEIVLESPESEKSFFEANSEVPSNEPDYASHFAAKNQQAAQLKESSITGSETPFVDGDEKDATRVVSQPFALSESLPQGSVSLSGGEGGQMTSASMPPASTHVLEPGEARGVSQMPQEVSNNEQSRKFVLNQESSSRKGSPSQAGASSEPLPRPRIQRSQATPGPLLSSNQGVARIGAVSVSTQFSQYGEYLQRLFEAVVMQWYLLLGDYHFSSEDYRSVVDVEFQLLASGEVNFVKVRQSTASQAATLFCQDSILSRQPFGSWSKDMKSQLGDEQTVRIRFRYF